MNSDDLVYNAERTLHVLGFPKNLTDGDAAFDFLQHIVESRYFCNRYPKLATKGITIQESKTVHGYAVIGENRILLPRWAMNTLYVCHELSHLCESDKKDDHGPNFRRCYVDLTSRFISKEAGKSLYYAFLAHGIPPAKR